MSEENNTESYISIMDAFHNLKETPEYKSFMSSLKEQGGFNCLTIETTDKGIFFYPKHCFVS